MMLSAVAAARRESLFVPIPRSDEHDAKIKEEWRMRKRRRLLFNEEWRMKNEE